MRYFVISFFFLSCCCYCGYNGKARSGDDPDPGNNKEEVQNFGINRDELYDEINKRVNTNTYTYVVNGKVIHLHNVNGYISSSHGHRYLFIVDDGATLSKTREYESVINNSYKDIHVIVVKPSHWFSKQIYDEKNNCYLIHSNGITKFTAEDPKDIVNKLKDIDDGNNNGSFNIHSFYKYVIAILLALIVFFFVNWRHERSYRK